MKKLLNKLYEEEKLDKDEIVHVLLHMDGTNRKLLHELAHTKRMAYYGNRVYLRGLIEFSNICKKDCLYCGIRMSNRNAERYRLTGEQILQCCDEGYQLGFRTFVLQSGEDSYFTEQRLVDLVKAIKRRYTDVAVTLSIGERDESTFRSLFEAGADRFLMRHETASRRIYEMLHPTSSFDNRINCLWTLKKIGYQVGSGFMVGLPEQTAENLAEDLLFLKDLHPDMIGIGPFIPHKDTPLYKARGGTLEETLTMVALARLFVPDALIPATTAVGTIHPQGRELALKAGANVVMPNLSPQSARKKYELYDNKICTGDESAQCRQCIEMRITTSGFQVDMGRGDSAQSIRKKGEMKV